MGCKGIVGTSSSNCLDKAVELLKKFSDSLPHIEALYMYVNKGSFNIQCLEELEARWPSMGLKAWSDVEREASKYEPQILVGALKHQIVKVIEERYGELLSSEVFKRTSLLNYEELAVVVAFSKMWVQGFKTTDEDELSTALEACLGIPGVKAIEILWKVGLVNRAHIPTISKYKPRIYVPGYVKPVIEKYSQYSLPLKVEIKALLEKALIEDPLKVCVAVYGVDQLIDELVRLMVGLPLNSIMHKFNIEGIMRVGRVCPLIVDDIERAWRQILEDKFSEILNLLYRAFESLGYTYRTTYDESMKLPVTYGYSNGLRVAMILMPAILPLNHVRSFSPDAIKVVFTSNLNAPPREAMDFLRLSSIVYVANREATIYGKEGVDYLMQLLEAGGFKVDVKT
ncbi:MAG: hypothetical protein QW701_00755 [Candidatus Nezhaarchaeales archaeon]